MTRKLIEALKKEWLVRVPFSGQYLLSEFNFRKNKVLKGSW